MTYIISNKCTKKFCKRTVLVEDVVTCFFGTQCSSGSEGKTLTILLLSESESESESLYLRTVICQADSDGS